MAGIDSDTITMLHLDGNATDSALVPLTYTNSNVTFSSTSPVFSGNQYGVFNGTNARLVTTTNFTNFAGTTTFTIDLWVKPTSSTAVNPIFVITDATTNNCLRFVSYGNGPGAPWGDNTIYFNVISSGSNGIGFTIPWVVDTSNWTHIAVERISNANSSSAWGGFINGVRQTLTLTSGAWNYSIPSIAFPAQIGGFPENGSQYFNGKIEEVRASDIARYSSDFTPESSPYSLNSTNLYRTLMGMGS